MNSVQCLMSKTGSSMKIGSWNSLKGWRGVSNGNPSTGLW